MPVRKFRSVTEMPGVKWRTPLDPDNLRLACELSQLAYWLHPMKHVPGVRKVPVGRGSVAGSQGVGA